MNRGRRVFRLGAAIFAMCDAIHRFFIFLFGKPQPIDWWLLGADLAIFVLIIWLDVPERLHSLKAQRRVAELEPFMVKGRVLQHSVPNPADAVEAEQTQDW